MINLTQRLPEESGPETGPPNASGSSRRSFTSARFIPMMSRCVSAGAVSVVCCKTLKTVQWRYRRRQNRAVPVSIP
jgi:hypothetical protein